MIDTIDADPATCCAACAKNSICNGWVSEKQSDRYSCRLKSNVVPHFSSVCQKEGSIFGIKPAPTPPPTPFPAYPKGASNVLMIAIDDMRPELSPYGFTHMHTPSIAALANRSTVFTRAYVQVAVCMPSRQALLTSRHPDTQMGWTISPQQNFRRCGGKCGANKCSQFEGGCGLPSLVTLPGWFRAHGFDTIGAGKIFHEGADSGYQATLQRRAESL